MPIMLFGEGVVNRRDVEKNASEKQPKNNAMATRVRLSATSWDEDWHHIVHNVNTIITLRRVYV